MEHLGPQCGQLQHLVVRNFLQHLRALDGAGVGGKDAVHVGINLTQVRVEHSGQGHRRGVRAAAAQGGNVVVFVDALEAGDDDNGLLVQLRQDPFGVNALDAGVSVGGVGAEPRLPPGQGDDRIAHSLNGHGAQGTGNLLPGGQEHIHLPLGAVGIDFSGLGDEVVGGVPLGGEHHHHVMAAAVSLCDNAGHVADAVGVRNGASAEFLYNESHGSVYLLGWEINGIPLGRAHPSQSILCRQDLPGLSVQHAEGRSGAVPGQAVLQGGAGQHLPGEEGQLFRRSIGAA